MPSDARDGIVEGGAGADVARQDVVAHGVHDDFAAAEGDAVLALVDLRHGGGAHGGESDELHDGGHGVGGELSAASAGAGAGVVLDIEEVGIAEFAAGVGAYGFEDVLDGDVVPFEFSRHDGAAIEHDAGDVEAEQRHGGAGDGFVAGDQGDDAVEHVAALHELDGVGDHLAADEGGLHALGAHGDAVGDGDGVELHGGAAGGADAFLDFDRELAQVVVARHGLDPGIGHADDGFGQIFVGEADGLEHGSRGGAVSSLSDGVALKFHSGESSLTAGEGERRRVNQAF